jgi:hypothetical protein
MKKNVGTIDRAIRGIAGLAGIALFATGTVTGTLGIVAVVMGGVLLGTAVIGWCPPYILLGVDTRGAESKE